MLLNAEIVGKNPRFDRAFSMPDSSAAQGPVACSAADDMAEIEEHRSIAVSARHEVRLAGEYLQLIDRAPAQDFVVHVIEKREANGLQLMSAEIVIASAATRARYPLAAKYPLHFRKTYFAGRLHGDPLVEYERSELASALLGGPPPIGHARSEFRSCLVPGTPFRRLSPFDADAEDSNLRRASDVQLAAAAGLWRLAEEAYQKLATLHAGGLAHGDAELQNFIVCPAPLEVVVIDFEAAQRRDELDAAGWNTRCELDCVPLFREATFLQATLGRQPGELAERARVAAPRLFRDASRIHRAIDQLRALS
jgi:hypothetical protein